jgi:DNA (cytosine-5)-methyltransferase 1
VLFLENVKNLMTHDGGKTFGTIKSILEGLGYDVFTKVLDTSDFGLPQHRERLYFVCFRNDIENRFDFKFPVGDKKSSLSDILEDKPENAKVIERNDIVFYKEYVPEKDENGKILIPNRPIQIGYLNKGGQGERIYHPLGHAVTLSAYGGGAGAKTGMYKINNKVRKLSPRECARAQGFPDEFKPHPKTNQAYKQFGNSVSVNVLQHIVFEISKILDRKA